MNNSNKLFSHNLSNIHLYNDPLSNVNYIKLYGSIDKFAGSHSDDLYDVLHSIKSHHNPPCDILDKLPNNIDTPDKKQYIYFNNIETCFNNKYYSEEDQHSDIPSAVFDGKVLCELINTFDIV